MYLAQTNTLQAQAPFYVNILEGIIGGGNYDIEAKEDIDNAINQAAEVVSGEKDIFAIDNDHYFLITTLLTKCQNSLGKLKDQGLTISIYTDILASLK